MGDQSKREKFDQPTWFKLSEPRIVRFGLLSHWSYVKGAVIDRIWQWSPHKPGSFHTNQSHSGEEAEDSDARLIDIAQHLMRSEISNSFFSNPDEHKNNFENEVKILTRREINQSRKIITLNFVFNLPKVADSKEYVVHCLTFGLRLLDPQTEELFLDNQNAIVSHCKQVIDKHSRCVFYAEADEFKKVSKTAISKKLSRKNLDFQKIRDNLFEDVRKVFEDIESMLCPTNGKWATLMRSPENDVMKEFAFFHVEDVKKFQKQVLFNHFRHAFNTVVVGSNKDRNNSLVSFLQTYSLEHEQDCVRFATTRVAVSPSPEK